MSEDNEEKIAFFILTQMLVYNIYMRACKPEEVQNWIEFLNNIFEYESPQSFGIDFSPIFEPKNLENSKLIFSKESNCEKIISSASLFPQECITPHGIIKVGIIAAVATHADHRGQGHSLEILKELEKNAQLQGLDALVLWSQNLEYYDKLGFKPFGKQQMFDLNGFDYDQEPQGMIVPGWGDPQDIKSVYNMHATRVNRSNEYWEQISKIKSVNRFHLKNPKTREIIAYLGIGRGKDMQNIIHEWGGSALALSYLLKQILMRSENLIWLTHPLMQDPIRNELGPTDLIQESSLGFIKLLKPVPEKVTETLWFWGLDSM